ncbi:MAG: hypothetical protein JWR38_3795 [Mucilaginibacter sp.]|nr:hypothetical protein [Mucilaginibacter sp.]
MNSPYYKIFIFLVLTIVINGCKPDPAVYPTKIVPIPGYTGKDPETNPVAGEYSLKGTLNGQALNWQVTDDSDGWVAGSVAATSNDEGGIVGSLTALISKSPVFQPQLGIEFGFIHTTFDSKSAAFNSFIKTGLWNFRNEFPADDQKFVSITYTDKDGNLYSSSKGTQTSGVNIISTTSIPPQSGMEESLKIKLTFSCKLYPVEGTGNPLTLTNVEATVRLENLL